MGGRDKQPEPSKPKNSGKPAQKASGRGKVVKRRSSKLIRTLRRRPKKLPKIQRYTGRSYETSYNPTHNFRVTTQSMGNYNPTSHFGDYHHVVQPDRDEFADVDEDEDDDEDEDEEIEEAFEDEDSNGLDRDDSSRDDREYGGGPSSLLAA